MRAANSWTFIGVRPAGTRRACCCSGTDRARAIVNMTSYVTTSHRRIMEQRMRMRTRASTRTHQLLYRTSFRERTERRHGHVLVGARTMRIIRSLTRLLQIVQSRYFSIACGGGCSSSYSSLLLGSKAAPKCGLWIDYGTVRRTYQTVGLVGGVAEVRKRKKQIG